MHPILFSYITSFSLYCTTTARYITGNRLHNRKPLKSACGAEGAILYVLWRLFFLQFLLRGTVKNNLTIIRNNSEQFGTIRNNSEQFGTIRNNWIFRFSEDFCFYNFTIIRNNWNLHSLRTFFLQFLFNGTVKNNFTTIRNNWIFTHLHTHRKYRLE